MSYSKVVDVLRLEFRTGWGFAGGVWVQGERFGVPSSELGVDGIDVWVQPTVDSETSMAMGLRGVGRRLG